MFVYNIFHFRLNYIDYFIQTRSLFDKKTFFLSTKGLGFTTAPIFFYDVSKIIFLCGKKLLVLFLRPIKAITLAFIFLEKFREFMPETFCQNTYYQENVIVELYQFHEKLSNRSSLMFFHDFLQNRFNRKSTFLWQKVQLFQKCYSTLKPPVLQSSAQSFGALCERKQLNVW